MTAPRPLASILPAELLTLVGKIAVQAVYVDFLLGEVYAGLKGVGADERAKTIHPLDSRFKSREAAKLAETVLQVPDRPAVIDAVNRAGELLADRNFVLHGVVVHRDPIANNPPEIVIFRGKYAGQPKLFSRETLEPIFTDLDQVSQELVAVCLKHGFSDIVPLPGKSQ